MAKFRLNDQVYKVRFWMRPGVGKSKTGITLREISSGPVEFIEGIRRGERLLELTISPGLPRKATEFFYDRKTGYLTIIYDGKPVLSYEFPAGYAHIPEELRIPERR